MTPQDNRHKTIGISLSPELRQQAAERARSLGLTFSKYTALCIESDLGGHPLPLLRNTTARTEVNVDQALLQGQEYGEMKALSIAFENDIAAVLEEAHFTHTRAEKVAHLRADFAVHHSPPPPQRPLRLLIECKYNLRNRYTVTLGQSLILQSLPQVDAVVLCVPYLKNFDPHMQTTFAAHHIPITTPDTLAATLRQLLAEKSLPPAQKGRAVTKPRARP